jgi:HEAT repeat protein
MEAVFILTEIADSKSASELVRIATSGNYKEDEIRQAAVWGLGKAGAKAYNQLIQFIDDDEDDVALHAIVGFDADTPNEIIDELVRLLIKGNQRQKAAICQILRLVGTDYVIGQLIQAAGQDINEKSWLVAALGQLPPDAVGAALQNSPLLDQVQPFFHLSHQENWLTPDDKISDLRFLLGQNI